MDGQDTEVVRGETPYSKSATQGRNAGVSALQHTICRDCVLLLASRLFLDVGNTIGNILRVDGVTATLAELDLVLELLTLIVQPLCDLSSAESKLSGAVADVEDGEGMLSRDFAGDRERPTTRCRNRATSLVAKENLNKQSSRSSDSWNLRGGRGEGDYSTNRSTELEGGLCAHEHLNAGPLRFHEL